MQSTSTLKILLVGAAGVGKSSILLRFCDNRFADDSCPTVGIDFKVKYVTIGNVRVKLAIWDTAGQERYRTLTPAYYRGAHGIIFVYDATNEGSFQQLNEWLDEADKYATKVDYVKMLVCNKIDKDTANRPVSREKGLRFARSNQMLFLETSAKSSFGVQLAFEELVEKIIQTPSLCQLETLERRVYRDTMQKPCNSCM